MALTSFQDNHPDGPLTIALARLGDDGTPSGVVAARTLAAEELRWAPHEIALRPMEAVKEGERYAIVVSSSSTRAGYGVAWSDDDPYRRGRALHSSDGGATWIAEAGVDLKFETSVIAHGGS
jgi:hypothetical protein